MHTGLEGHSIPKFLIPFLKPDHDHRDLSAMATYFETRAKGGVGLMVTGGISPNRAGWVGPFAAKLTTAHEVDFHKEVTERVHAIRIPSYSNEKGEAARICMQILHAGRYAHHPFAVSASATQAPISSFQAKELSLGEVHGTIADFVNCAVLAKEAGYDGVEIMGSEGYLINQFLVQRTNHRRDEYGGDFTNRMRFAVDIVKQTRQAVGKDFIIIFRLSMLDLVEEGSSWSEIKLLAQAIEDAGATIINTGIGWHEARVPTIQTSVPRGTFAWVTKKLRDENVVSIPLCATNRFNAPHVGNKVLQDEYADLISMARPFLADPDILAQSREGMVEDINTCIACNQACLDHAFIGKTASCLVNPIACHETELSIQPNSVSKEHRLNIGVIGAGPAGLAFAATAATIGHHVSLYDEADEIGGQFNMAKRIPGKEEFHETIRYFRWKLKMLQDHGKLTIKLGTKISHGDMINNQNIDKWIVATGVNPRTPSIPGLDHPNVLSYIDVLRNRKHVGKNVAIIGAGGIGFDVAEYLLHHIEGDPDKLADEVSINEWLDDWGVDASSTKRGGLEKDCSKIVPKHLSGRSITMLQRKSGKLGKGLGKTTGWIHRSTLAKSRAVEFLGSVTYDKVDDQGHLHITLHKGTPQESQRVLPVDNIVLCAGQTPKNDLEQVSGPLSSKVYTIGGAYEALELDAKRAIDMGTRLALKIQDPEVVPGKHEFKAGSGPEEKLFQLFKKFM
jgi:2,4-dienoyl-CoA reductase (NADPH2)